MSSAHSNHNTGILSQARYPGNSNDSWPATSSFSREVSSSPISYREPQATAVTAASMPSSEHSQDTAAAAVGAAKEDVLQPSAPSAPSGETKPLAEVSFFQNESRTFNNVTTQVSPLLALSTSPLPSCPPFSNGHGSVITASGTSGINSSLTSVSVSSSPGPCLGNVSHIDDLSRTSIPTDRIESNFIPPGSPLSRLPSYVRRLLIKGRVSSTPCYLSPYRCVLTRHPVHRDSTESHINYLVAKIRDEGYNEALAAPAPLVAVRYSKPLTVPTRAAGSSRATVYDSWSDHPLIYAIAGAGRGEAIAQLVQSNSKVKLKKSDFSDHLPNPTNDHSPAPLSTHAEQSDDACPKDAADAVPPRALAFYLLTAGENLSGWEIFLLSTALNAADPNSRPPNYFERTDQIAFICLEISRRKQGDALCRDIAIEICSNPFLSELRDHLQLTPASVLPLQSLTDTQTPAEILQKLMQSRTVYPWLPPNTGVLPQKVPLHQLETLDVMIDMATCVNAEKMKRVSPASLREGGRKLTGRPSGAESATGSNRSGATTSDCPGTKAEGFLHAVAEDQLRYLFRQIVPVKSAAVFNVLVIRDLVSVVFGAIQECSRQFRQSVGVRKPTETADVDASASALPEFLATSPAAGAYWVERIVYEATTGGLLAGLWNFPAAALVVLFYIYFVNRIQVFDKEDIQTRLLKVGTTLYRCIAELALTLRASKITLMTAPVSTQLRILEGASILFRLALFGVVHVECFPPHPYLIPVSSLDCSSSYCNPTFVPRAGSGSEQATAPYSVRTFTDFDQCYEFLYGYWFKGLIHARLFPTQEYRRSASATSSATVASSVSTAPSLSSPALSISVHDPSVSAASSTLLPPAELVPPSFSGTASPRRPWYESRRIEVAATANRLRQEVESIVAQQGETALSTNDRIQVRRALKRSPFAVPASALLPTDTSGGSADYVEVEMLDPSVLPMAHSAKLEFQSLVQGVVTMLIERHRCWDMTSNASSVTSGKVQFLSVPANMVVLAAIKVALTFISPHFDRLAPHLVDWITVRCRLILWIWRECRAEVVRRAEERWQELWLKHRSRGPPPPRLKIRFTSMQRTDGHYVDLTAAKLGEVVLGVLPGVLESMISFYEQRENTQDDTVAREFFAKWLRSAGDSDLVTQVNALLTQPLSLNKIAPLLNDTAGLLSFPSRDSSLIMGTPSSETVGGITAVNVAQEYTAQQQSKRPRSDTIQPPSRLNDVPTTAAYSASGAFSSVPLVSRSTAAAVATSSPPATVLPPPTNSMTASHHSLLSSSNRATPYFTNVPPPSRANALGGKKSKKNSALNARSGVAGDGTDDFIQWLDSLPYSERLRLDGQDVPQWELPRVTLVPPPDLLRWRPPENVHPFVGNGLKGPPFDARAWRRYRIMERCALQQRNDPPPPTDPHDLTSASSPTSMCETVVPLSDFDWKITAGVLKLLRSRGVDTLVSRNRGKICYLDDVLDYSESLAHQLDLPPDWDHDDEDAPQPALSTQAPPSTQPDDDESSKKREAPLSAAGPQKRRKHAGSIAAQRRYGAAFFKSHDPLSLLPQDQLASHIPDLDCLRSFLEYDVLAE